MPRTTIDLDAAVLRELKRRQRADGRSLGRLASDLLSVALASEAQTSVAPFRWTSRRMDARVDLEDAAAVRRALDDE